MCKNCEPDPKIPTKKLTCQQQIDRREKYEM